MSRTTAWKHILCLFTQAISVTTWRWTRDHNQLGEGHSFHFKGDGKLERKATGETSFTTPRLFPCMVHRNPPQLCRPSMNLLGIFRRVLRRRVKVASCGHALQLGSNGTDVGISHNLNRRMQWNTMGVHLIPDVSANYMENSWYIRKISCWSFLLPLHDYHSDAEQTGTVFPDNPEKEVTLSRK